MKVALGLDPAAYLRTPELFAAKVVPDGRKVAWVWLNHGTHANVYVSRDGAPPLRLTDDTQNHWLFGWAKDGEHLVLGTDTGSGNMAIWIADARARSALKLLWAAQPGRQVAHAEVDDQRRWLYLSVTTADSTEFLQVDLHSGEEHVVCALPRAEYVVPGLGADGRYLMWISSRLDGPGSALHLVRTRDRAYAEMLAFEAGLQVRAEWHRNGQQVILVADHPAHTHKRVGWYDLASGQLAWLIDDPQRAPEFAFNPPGQDLICVNEICGGRTRTVLLDPTSASEQPFDMPGLQGVPSGFDSATDAWTVLAYGPQQPADLMRVMATRDGLAVQGSLTCFWEQVPYAQDDVFPAEEVHWHSTDGQAVHGYLYRNPALNRGTVALLHPGPHEVALPRFDAHVQYLVRLGFNVFEPNYRGSIGYGVGFRNALYEDGWGGLEQHDIRTGLLHLLEQGVARRGRIAAMGYSYGGYSALCQATFVSPDLMNAAISVNGMTDLIADYEFTDSTVRPCIVQGLGGTPDTHAAKYRARSPVQYAASTEADILLVHGRQDTNVHRVNHDRMLAALEAYDKRVKVLTFEDEGHSIRRHDNFVRLMRQVEATLIHAFYRAYNELR